MYSEERCLIFDESGNLGLNGRYFVIACVDTSNAKALHNIMKRKIKKAEELFPEIKKNHSNEIKAKDAHPCVKHHIIESIISKDLSISYIVIDLKHVKEKLLKDKNILYNYAAKLLISRLITDKDNNKTVNIIFDNKTTKIASTNSLKEYIIAQIIYEEDLDVMIHFEYKDSDAGDAFIIQAADYVANAIYTKYEEGNSIYADLMKDKYKVQEFFPYKLFGK